MGLSKHGGPHVSALLPLEPEQIDPACSLHKATNHILCWILYWNRKNDGSKKSPKVRKHGVAVFGQARVRKRGEGGRTKANGANPVPQNTPPASAAAAPSPHTSDPPASSALSVIGLSASGAGPCSASQATSVVCALSEAAWAADSASGRRSISFRSAGIRMAARMAGASITRLVAVVAVVALRAATSVGTETEGAGLGAAAAGPLLRLVGVLQ